MLGVGDGAGDNGVCRLGMQSLTADMRQGDELSAYRPGCRGNPNFKVRKRAGLGRFGPCVREGWRPQVGVLDLLCFVRGTDG